MERLLEHERFKNAAQMLQQKQMLEAATWTNPGVREFKDDAAAEPEIAADTVDLVRIFRDILERARNRPVIDVEEDSVTVGQMIQFLARRLTMEDKPVALRRLLSHTKSERALIAMFLALLELVRLQAILLRQDRHFSEIFIKKHTGFDAVMNEGLATRGTTGGRVPVITCVIIGHRLRFVMATRPKSSQSAIRPASFCPRRHLSASTFARATRSICKRLLRACRSLRTTRSSRQKWRLPSA